MQVWEQRLNQMLDQVADYADDWNEVLEMVAVADNKGERQLLHDYLEYLVPRIKNMQRQFNWVTYDQSNHAYVIHNYTLDVFRYMRESYPQDAVITPNRITIGAEVLKPIDKEKLQKQLVP